MFLKNPLRSKEGLLFRSSYMLVKVGPTDFGDILINMASWENSIFMKMTFILGTRIGTL